ncbi:DUF4215 domain-containing protein [Nannocystis sp.]|uniref:DUF4215 domain-containing protein n=1 Tax=Nannocystis sp. TaxID=1962667 RepID=UPI0025FE0025|nr:DUF4215 domain-containing protein [Nannocystis sp.]MBK7830280.1 hypothetical protein [Nannocystis sp.]
MTGRLTLFTLLLVSCSFDTPGFGGDNLTTTAATSEATEVGSASSGLVTSASTSGDPTTIEPTTAQATTTLTTESTGGSSGPGPNCGNAVVDPGEDCDDGNDDNSDACTSFCLDAICGDGFVRTGVEPCDDGNSDDTDDCTSVCAAPACGDGFVHAATEVCDDGNTSKGDDCRSDCMAVAVCGDKDVNLKGDPKRGLLEDCEPKLLDDPICTDTCKTLNRLQMQAVQVTRPILKATKPEDISLAQECLRFETQLANDYPLVVYNILVDLPIVHPTVGHLAIFLTHVRGQQTQTVLLMSRPGFIEQSAFDSTPGGHDASLLANTHLLFRTDGLYMPSPAESVGEGVAPNANLVCDKGTCQITPDAGSNTDPYDPNAVIGTLAGGQWYVCVIDPVGPDDPANAVKKSSLTLDLVAAK